MQAATPGEFYPAFEKMVHAGVSALLVGGSAFFTSQRNRLAVLHRAARHSGKLFGSRVSGGGRPHELRPSQTDAYRRAGVYVGRILKGEKPGELPIEQPTKF